MCWYSSTTTCATATGCIIAIIYACVSYHVASTNGVVIHDSNLPAYLSGGTRRNWTNTEVQDVDAELSLDTPDPDGYFTGTLTTGGAGDHPALLQGTFDVHGHWELKHDEQKEVHMAFHVVWKNDDVNHHKASAFAGAFNNGNKSITLSAARSDGVMLTDTVFLRS